MVFGLSAGVYSSGSKESIFEPVKYTGNGSTQSITGVGFQPDLVWIKQRNVGAKQHVLSDDVRGTNSQLFSDAISAEGTATTAITSFDSDGFSLGALTTVNNNSGGETYVSWNFLENVKCFDIVSYVGNGANRTIAHSLSVAPELIIVKRRDGGTSHWAVYHTGANLGVTPEQFKLRLSTGEAEASDSTAWNNTAPTSSVFSVGTSLEVNSNTDNYIAYLFSSLSGTCKVGAYAGTGSAGLAINIGFTPKFVMIKRANSGPNVNWFIFDTARGDNIALQADEAFDESTIGSFGVDLRAGGFTVNSTDSELNADTSGSNDYIYLAVR